MRNQSQRCEKTILKVKDMEHNEVIKTSGIFN